MSQNTSSAVMQQRSEPNDSLDDFPTPPWATRALCQWLESQDELVGQMTCREPAANRGFMARTLAEHFKTVVASDVHDYGAGYPVEDYLFGPADFTPTTQFTITNPPFRLAEQFIARALARSSIGVAMIVRSSFLEGQDRYKTLFSQEPPTHVLQFTERVGMFRGRMVRVGDPDPANIDPKTGEPRKASTATSYCWLVWLRWEFQRERSTRLVWIPPIRRILERAGDYPEAAA